MTWTTTQLEDWTIHVHPDNDAIPHVLTEGCICGPTPELHEAKDGGDNWLYIHHSLDGREASEP